MNRNLREHFFMQRMLGVWNELPEVAAEAGTIAKFKGHSDRYMYRTCLEGCVPNAGRLAGVGKLVRRDSIKLMPMWVSFNSHVVPDFLHNELVV